MRAVVTGEDGLLAGAKPGLVILIPFVDKMVKVSLRTITMDVPPQDVITRDNVTVKVNAVIYFRVMQADRAFLQVTLPAAKSGLITAMILGIARVIGETAPLILTVNNANGTTVDMSQPMASLPTYIFQYVRYVYDTSIQRAWGAALMVLLLVAVLFTAARLVSRDKKAKRK